MSGPDLFIDNNEMRPPRRGPAPFDLGELIMRDMTDTGSAILPVVVEKADELATAINNDKLTGLLNREGLTRLFEEYAMLGPYKFGLLFIDLKDFKRYNDEHPEKHAGGDELLKNFSICLERFVRQKNGGTGDRIHGTRLGGDEFVAFIDLDTLRKTQTEDLTPDQRLEAARTNLIYNARHGILQETGVDISVGSAVWDGEASLDELILKADRQMYEHKAAQKAVKGSYR